MSAASLRNLIQNAGQELFLMFDERMIPAYLLGMVEHYSRQAAFNGQNSISAGAVFFIILLEMIITFY
jgi:hypothetical protein